MTNSYSKRCTILLLTLTSLLIILACQWAGDSEPGIPSTQDAPAAPEKMIVQADLVFGPGSFVYPDPMAGLADLSSYKATLTLTFNGTRDGQPSQWSKTYVMLAAKDPAARLLTIEKTENLTEFDPDLMAEINGVTYERLGGSACNANVIEPANSLIGRFEPAGFLNGVIGAEEAGVETVNDVAANHYTFDERAFGQLGITQTTGEIWVASDGGYIVRYLLTTKGSKEYFGEGIEGTLTIDYELTGVNQPVTLALPDDCPAGMINAPLLPDAANILNMPSVLRYETSTSLADVVAYYQEQIPILGWTPLNKPTVAETTAFLKYTRGDQEMTIMITAETDMRKVTMMQAQVQK